MAEAEYRDGDEPALPEEEENEEETAVVDAEDEDGVEKEKPIPVSTFKPQPPLPAHIFFPRLVSHSPSRSRRRENV